MTDQDKQDTEYVVGEDGYIYMVARDLNKITTYTYRIWAYDETDDKLFGYTDFSTAKTWCDGKGENCSGFVQCGICGGDGTCNHPSPTKPWGAYMINRPEVTVIAPAGRYSKANYRYLALSSCPDCRFRSAIWYV